jgi:hypothetical protein
MSVIDQSLTKAPYGKGPQGPATIDGWSFRIDPSSVQLPIRAKVQKFRTVGGFVVQVYGTTWGDLTITGQFGTGGWRAQLGFLDRMVKIGLAQSIQRAPSQAGQNFTPSQPFRFTYPLLGWDFLCYLKAFTSPDGSLAVHMANTNINPKWTLTLFVVTDNGSLTEVTKTAYLQRLAPGLGLMWDSASSPEKYQGYSDDQYNAPLNNALLQPYINNPGGGYEDVVSATPSSFTGPTTSATGGGTTGVAPGGPVTNSLTFAQALLTGLGAHVVTQNTNLVRAWECQEGMWPQSVTASWPGGYSVWGPPSTCNPLNLGGWSTLPDGAKTTYPQVPGKNYPVTVLSYSGLGDVFSFGGNWNAGVDAAVWALHNENPQWPAIAQALVDNDPAAFFTAVHYWNAGQTVPARYEVLVQNHYDSGDYVGAGF